MLPTPDKAAYSGPFLSEEDKHVGEAVSVQEARQAELDEVIRVGTNIEQLIKELCPDGVPYVRLGDIAKTLAGLNGKTKSDFEHGGCRYISYRNIFNNPSVDQCRDDFVSVKQGERQNSVEYGDLLITASSESREELGMAAVIDVPPTEPIYVNSFSFIVRFNNPDQVRAGYLRHLFRSSLIRSQISQAGAGVTRINISKPKFMNICIPIPPVEVQEEIVRILDLFTELEAELEAELEKRHLQYAHYRVKLLKSSGVSEFKLLGDIARIRNGKDHKHLADGSVPVYGSGGIMRYVETSNAQGPSVLIPRKGSLGNIFYVEGPFWNVDTIFSTEIDTSIVEPRFLFHQLLTMKLGEMNQAGGVPSQTQSVLNRLRILVPPIEEQRRIVNILDQMDALVNDLSSGLPAEIAARRKQYEHYRDRLLSFPELKKDEPTGSTEGALPEE